jgi:Tol biopolymer transport system component
MLVFKCARLTAAVCLLIGTTPALSVETGSPRTLLEWHGHRLFEDFSARSEVSPDGKWVLRTSLEGSQALLTLPDGIRDDRTLKDDTPNFERAAWCGPGLLRVGTRAKGRHWYASTGTAAVELTVPPDATPVCSPDGKQLAHFTSSATLPGLPLPKSIFVGSLMSQSEIKLGGVVMSAHFAPDGRRLYALARQDDGASSLFAITIQSHQIDLLARDLDAWPFPGPELAVTRDGTGIILPLATTSHPIDAERQIPDLRKRWLKLYRFDPDSRQLTLLRSSERSDQSDPVVVGSTLYWVSGHNTKSVVAVPVAGGPMHIVVSGREQYAPSWSRDGKRIAYVIGDYRLADWALTQDVETVPVDAQARVTGPARSFIVGNHEDFPPDWSPDGRWIAWHSHRATRDPPYYDAPGTTDDIWIRRAEDTHAPEIRATHDLWETGLTYWSPDGRELIYTTLDRKDPSAYYQVRVSTFDPNTGQLMGEHRFPMPAQVHNPLIAVWSPSGAEVAVEDSTSPSGHTLWIVSRDGQHLTQIVNYQSETYGGIAWTPDGATLIYAGLEGSRMQIFSVDRHGGAPRRLSDGTGNDLLPRVSPDGHWVACSRVETVETLQEMTLP